MKEFLLQWHITAKCDQNCKHCYMHEAPTFESEIRNELDTPTCKGIIDEYAALMKRWDMVGTINFTGGDPLLRKDFLEIAGYASKKGIRVGVLGNPYRINEGTAKALKQLGITHFQLSIDGSEKTHDMFRKKGSFKATKKAIETLRKHGIKVNIMMTTSRVNKNDIFSVIDFCVAEKVNSFNFARLVPSGCGLHLKDEVIPGREYREFLMAVYDKYEELKAQGCTTRMGMKDNLWKLLLFEMGKQTPTGGDCYQGGCSMGIFLSILADGLVYSCRRLPITVGKLPKDKLKDIIVNSPEMKQMRNPKMLDKCQHCELINICRGCPAVAYGLDGDYNYPDPSCWHSAKSALVKEEVEYGSQVS